MVIKFLKIMSLKARNGLGNKNNRLNRIAQLRVLFQYLIVIVLFASCTQSPKSYQGKLQVEEGQPEKPKAKPEELKVWVGTSITGDFDGDGIVETANAVKVKTGSGNPVEDGTPDEYEVQFSTKNIKPIAAGCCEMRLVNEGDLNNDGNDEISIFQAPMNGCTYTMTTYTLRAGKWKVLLVPFLVPTACDPFSNEEIEERVFLENNKIFYYKIDANDESFKLIKTLAELK